MKGEGMVGENQKKKSPGDLEAGPPAEAVAILKLDLLRTYRLSWLPGDLLAGLIIFGVTIPTAIAYSQLAGLHPINGLYASLLAMALYPLLGTSRQAVIGAEDTTAILVAASLATIVTGGPDPARYLALAMLQAIMVGAILTVGGVFRVGFIADFIPKTIITGFLNGMALIMIISQIGIMTGIELTQNDFFPRAWEFYTKIPQYHQLTLLVGVASLIGLFLFLFMSPKIPGAIVVVAVATGAVILWNLGPQDIKLVGSVPQGLPEPVIPKIDFDDILNLLPLSAGVALVAYFDVISTARAFAVKNRYELDANQDMIALGVANLGSGFCQGFSLGCSQSRTAVSDIYGGKSQFASLFAAGLLGLFLLYYTHILQNVPIVALTAIIIMAAIRLFDPVTVFKDWRTRPASAYLSLVTTLAVLIAGLMVGILVAVALAIIAVLHRLTRPHETVIRPPVVPGLLLYRFAGPLFFFNAPYFASRIRELIDSARPQVTFILINAEAIVDMDTDATEMLEELYYDIRSRGIVLGICGAKGHFRKVLDNTGLISQEGFNNYCTLAEAMRELRRARELSQQQPKEENIAPPQTTSSLEV